MKFHALLCAAAVNLMSFEAQAQSQPTSVLIAQTVVEAGEDCAAGGVRIDVGVDRDRDGVLDPREVTSSSAICNGADGADGADGVDGADGADGVSVTAMSLDVGDADCPAGGSSFIDGAGIVTYACNGIDGADGAKGADGADGVDGADCDTAEIEALHDRIDALECALDPRRVFVTAESFVPAEIAGAEAADDLCQSAAEAAGLDGTFRAWISDSTSDAIDRFEDGTCWKRMDDVVVADDLDDLTDGALSALIEVDEYGAARSGLVWTGTAVDGTGTGHHCDDWSDLDGDATLGSAADDDDGASPGSWTAHGDGSCSGSRPIYCFEQ